jgi:hypothetical protein
MPSTIPDDAARRAQQARHRRYREKNRGKLNALQRARYAANRTSMLHKVAVERHGPDVASVTAALWEQQGGKCYLCGIYLVPDAGSSVVLDHDHRCCPKQKSCQYCRRGLACDYCNTLVGLADDDAALLRQIADNLEAAIADVTARLASKPRQLHIEDGAR